MTKKMLALFVLLIVGLLCVVPAGAESGFSVLSESDLLEVGLPVEGRLMFTLDRSAGQVSNVTEIADGAFADASGIISVIQVSGNHNTITLNMNFDIDIMFADEMVDFLIDYAIIPEELAF